jgi:methyl-accepting chemotaxis protein
MVAAAQAAEELQLFARQTAKALSEQTQAVDSLAEEGSRQASSLKTIAASSRQQATASAQIAASTEQVRLRMSEVASGTAEQAKAARMIVDDLRGAATQLGKLRLLHGEQTQAASGLVAAIGEAASRDGAAGVV